MESNLASVTPQEVSQSNLLNQKIKPPIWFILLLIIYTPILLMSSWISAYLKIIVKERYVKFGLDEPSWSVLPQLISFSLLVSIILIVVSSFYFTPVIKKFLSMIVLVPVILIIVFVTLFLTTLPNVQEARSAAERRVHIFDEEVSPLLESIKDSMPGILSKVSCASKYESGSPKTCFSPTFFTGRDTLLSDEEVKMLEVSLRDLSPLISKYKNLRYDNDYFKQSEGKYLMTVRVISPPPYTRECLNKFYLNYVCDVYSDKVSCSNKTLEVCKR